MVLNYKWNFQNWRIHKDFTQSDHIYLHKRPLYLIVQISIFRFLKEHYILYLLIAYCLTVNFPGVQTHIVQNACLCNSSLFAVAKYTQSLLLKNAFVHDSFVFIMTHNHINKGYSAPSGSVWVWILNAAVLANKGEIMLEWLEKGRIGKCNGNVVKAAGVGTLFNHVLEKSLICYNYICMETLNF